MKCRPPQLISQTVQPSALVAIAETSEDHGDGQPEKTNSQEPALNTSASGAAKNAVTPQSELQELVIKNGFTFENNFPLGLRRFWATLQSRQEVARISMPSTRKLPPGCSMPKPDCSRD